MSYRYNYCFFPSIRCDFVKITGAKAEACTSNIDINHDRKIYIANETLKLSGRFEIKNASVGHNFQL